MNTQEITDLTEAVNEMSEAVADQLKGLNQSIEKTADLLPESAKIFWVDPDSGSDTTGTGTKGKPFASIEQACDQVPVGGFGRINLLPNKTYVLTEDAILINKVIVIQGISTVKAEYPIIVSTNYAITEFGTEKTGIKGFWLDHSSLSFMYLQVKTPDYLNDSPRWAFDSGFIKRIDRASGYVNLYDVDVEINDLSFVHLSGGPNFLHINLYYTTISRSADKVGYMVFNENSRVFSLSGAVTTLNDSLSWSDLIPNILRDVNGEPTNILTNLNL